MSKSFNYSSYNFLPSPSTDDSHEFADPATSSVLLNRYSVENSWSNLWRSGLPEQKLTVWLPRRVTDYDDEHPLYKLNEASSKMKLQKHSFSDLSFLKSDSSLTLKTIQKYSPYINVTPNSYRSSNADCAGDNNIDNSTPNNSRLSSILHKFGDVHLSHSDGSSKLTVIGNSYPIDRPPDIKEKTLAQLSLIRKKENCITSIGFDTNSKCFMDPMIGAPAEFLNRINELSRLQPVTKRWERARCRPRVRKKMAVNK
uniref:SJCHGC04953 protein n=1 Tax=Schistosoma japonicum TaxID=6182 RepID=Q5DAI6_SCHJA|nr:SJCHGC04953 protein [Schistosoma japonicum]